MITLVEQGITNWPQAWAFASVMVMLIGVAWAVAWLIVRLALGSDHVPEEDE